MRCGGGNWVIVGDFVTDQFVLHSVGLFLLGSDVANNASVGDLAISGHLIYVDEKICVCSLYIFDTLE